MAEETEFVVVELDNLIWPTSLQLPTGQFRLFVAADTDNATVDEISRFSEAAIGRGMVYLCAWGLGCGRFHDIVDEIVVGNAVGIIRFAVFTIAVADHVMTTWHDDETLEEALKFFTTCAVPEDKYATDSKYRVVISVGNPEWASEATRFLKAAEFLG